MRHDGWFYMFISYDACCRGVNSTYNIRIGRSKKVDGPYTDMDGVPMLEGGGTPLLASYGDVRGPGHNGVLTDASGRDWMVHHFYDAAMYGLARLQVRRIVWMNDGWPVVGEPVDRPVVAAAATEPALTPTIAGPWKVSVNFAADRAMEFRQDGSIDVGGSWKVVDGFLELNLTGTAERCAIDDGGEWFVGRDRDDLVVRGRRGK
jgi:arabinan endo-1,5-alpha-L-arabinosidase